MKKTIRMFVLGLALALCLIPALAACDSSDTPDESNADTTAETTAPGTDETDADEEATTADDADVTEEVTEDGTDSESTDATEESTDAGNDQEPGNETEEGTTQEPGDATDEETTAGSDETQDEVIEGTRISKYPSMDKTKYVIMYSLAAPDATAGTVKCSFVLYGSDDAVIDYVIFDLVTNGTEPDILDFKGVTWEHDHCVARAKNRDGSTQEFTLSYSK